MANLSQQKREKMLSFLQSLKQIHSDDTSIIALNEIENALLNKKYGLVWEEHSEYVDEMLQEHIPVFVEDTIRKITTSDCPAIVQRLSSDCPAIVQQDYEKFNFLIEGDNLHSLKLLEKTHRNKIDVIYIDPPYNTGNKDFIYDDCYIDKNDGYTHSKWLSFMSKRLEIARNLLSKTGVIFISIDNNEYANLKLLCDQIWGESNFVTTIHIELSATQGMKVKAAKEGNIVKNGEYILVYSTSQNKKIGLIQLKDPVEYDNHYNIFLEKSGEYYLETPLNEVLLKNEEIYNELSALRMLSKKNKLSNNNISKIYMKSELARNFINQNADKICRTHDTIDIDKTFMQKMKENHVYQYDTQDRSYLVSLHKGGVFQKILFSDKLDYADDFYSTFGPTRIRGDWWSGFYLDMGNVKKEGKVEFKNGKKPIRLIKQILKFSAPTNSIILDFFAGSGTTGHAVAQLNKEDGGNRQYILCTNNENNICEEVTYQRLKNIQTDLPHNLKYFKTDFIKKFDENNGTLKAQLMDYIKELIELEYMCEIDGLHNILIKNESELDAMLNDNLPIKARLFIAPYVLLSRTQNALVAKKQATLIEIPEYYFRHELIEAGEL